MSTASARPIAMTVAGFDPSSGAGITADLAVFEAHDCFGISAVTALTVQSTTGVRRVQPTDAVLLAETLACLEDDLPPIGIKIGMLANEANVRAVSAYLRGVRNSRKVLVVLDPVITASSGSALLSDAGLNALKRELLSQVDVVTPNTDELQVLSGVPCSDEASIRSAMAVLVQRVPSLFVIATGGHRPQPDDLLLHDGRITVLPGRRIDTEATHGTGCAFSSALLAEWMLRGDLLEAAKAAKRYVEGAMLHAEPMGRGKGPMRLGWPLMPNR